MKRRTAMLLSAALLAASAAALSPVSPASATPPEVCAGLGVATTGAPLTYPGIGPAVLTGFGFALPTGACTTLGTAPGKALTATGEVHGWCGLSTGTGVTGNGAVFAWAGVGGTLVLAGDLVGAVNAVPNVLGGESCTGGADNFLVNGAVVLNPTSCAPSVTTGTGIGGTGLDPLFTSNATHGCGPGVNGTMSTNRHGTTTTSTTPLL